MNIKALCVSALCLAPSAALAQGSALWEGLYIGAGGAATDLSFSVTPTFDASGTALSAFVGYNFVLGPTFVAGVEGNVIVGDITGSTFFGFPAIEDAFSIRARGGYAAGDALFYGGVGYTSATFNLALIDFDPATGAQAFLGIDYSVLDNLFVRFEYQHMVLDLDSAVFGPNETVTGNTVTAGLGLRF